MILFYASTELGTLVSFPMYIFFEIRSQFMNFDRLSGTWTRIYSEACRNHGPGLKKEKSHRKEKAIYQRKRQIHILRNKKQF